MNLLGRISDVNSEERRSNEILVTRERIMIVTKRKSMSEIQSALGEKRKLFFVGCGACAEQCQTGGPVDLKRAVEEFQDAGYSVVGSVCVEETCYIQRVRLRLAENADALEEAEAVVVFSCGAGVQAVAEQIDKRVVAALDSTFMGTVRRVGIFDEQCSLCGECILNFTGGLCPVTRCPKGIVNGPCGGGEGEMCEVDETKKCVWLEIYNKLKASGDEEIFAKIRAPKDFKTQAKPARQEVRRKK